MSILKRLSKAARGRVARFGQSERGNIAIMTAFTVVTMTLTVGGSVDLFTYETERRRVQTIVDRCILLGSRVSNGAETERDIRRLVRDCGKRQGVKWQDFKVTILENNVSDGIRKVKGEYTAEMKTSFMQLAGIDSMQIRAESQAEDQEQYAEISLVLDLSASMVGPVSTTDERRRIDVLRAASQQFVTRLLANGGSASTSINLVPYSFQVNIGRDLFGRLATSSTNLTRKQDYDSCAAISFSGNAMPTVSSAIANMEQPNATYTFGAEFRHYFDGGRPSDLLVRTNVQAPRYFSKYVQENGDNSDPIWGNYTLKSYYLDRNTSNESDVRGTNCAPDPHAYLLEPYQPNLGVSEPSFTNGLPWVTVGSRNLPLYRKAIAEHILECEHVERYKADPRRKSNGQLQLYKQNGDTTNNDNGNRYYYYDYDDDPTPHCEDPTPGSAPAPVVKDSSEAPDGIPVISQSVGEFVNREALKVDERTGAIIFNSNDETELADRIANLPVLSGTSTDQGAAWGYLLLHPDMRTHMGNARRSQIGDEPQNARPRDFYNPASGSSVGDSLPAAHPARKNKKYLIILSDGAISRNKQPAYEGGSGNYKDAAVDFYDYRDFLGSQGSQTYDKTAAQTQYESVCTEAKNNGVIVYTIAFALDDEDAKAALEKCASGDDTALSAGSNLDQTFNKIAATIERLRLVPQS